jgi:hypothetical protein
VLKRGKSKLCFVDATLSGVKVVVLVDTNATHGFISERTATLLHYKYERSIVAYKVVNSMVKLVTGVIRSAPLRVNIWFGTWDLMVDLLDDHAMILGQYFLKYSRALPMPHEGFLVLLY